MKRLVLVGGGHAQVEVLRQLALGEERGWDVTLVTPYPWLTYSGMVPGHFAGHYELDQCTIDLAALARRARARLALTTATLVSADANEVVCADGTVVGYDVLSLDVGGTPAIGAARGVERHAVLVRPLEKAVKGWNQVLAQARDGHMGSITVVGGGAAGVELALAMRHRLLRELYEAAPHVRVLGDGDDIAPNFPIAARAALRRHLRRHGVEVQTGSAVAEVGEGFVKLRSGLQFATDAVFWVTGTSAPEWLKQSGFACDERGFLLTNDLMQSPSHPNVFGAGDCVNELGRPLPKAGVFAVRAGPILAANLAAALEGRALQAYIPQKRYLALVSTGDRRAVGVWDGFSWSGAWAWRWKDRIDRRFVARYRLDQSKT